MQQQGLLHRDRSSRVARVAQSVSNPPHTHHTNSNTTLYDTMISRLTLFLLACSLTHSEGLDAAVSLAQSQSQVVLDSSAVPGEVVNGTSERAGSPRDTAVDSPGLSEAEGLRLVADGCVSHTFSHTHEHTATETIFVS